MRTYPWGMVLVFAGVLLLGIRTRLAGPQYAKNPQPPPATVTFLSVPKPAPKRKEWHPPHVLKTWTSRYKVRIFRVIQLPRCEHVETVITYEPAGETLRRARLRAGGAAAMSGSFHSTRSQALADFFQRKGRLYVGARTGRHLLVVHGDGELEITADYRGHRRMPGVTAIALGQRLLPLSRDGFSTAFMNEVTDRMAIGLNKHYIFIVQGKSDIWRLAAFIDHKLPATAALNSDGGHVVKGRAPVHIVFRWKQKGMARRLPNSR